MISELTYKELKPSFDLKYIKEQLEQKTSAVAVIGQPRAERALSFGLRTRAEGYNIYVSGPVDSGRISAVMKLATEAAEKLPPPPDICCVYNFDDAKTPVLLTFPAGGGRDFKTDMEELIELVKMDIRQTFASPEFEDVKNSIVRKYRDGRDLIIKEITKEAKEYNFGVKSTTAGVYFVPIIDGEIISEEQYDALPEEVKNAINKQSGEVQSQTAGILRRMRQFDRAVVTDVGNFEFSSALFAIGQRFVAIIEKYYNNPKVCEYVKKVKEDILENFDDFFEQEDDESSEMTSLMPWLVKKSPDEVFAKYKINLLVDNSTLTHAPVIVDLKPSHFELVGEVEYDSEYGNLTADFMKIKPGTLHRANGGFLIIPARDAFSVPHVYDALRKTLKTKQITTEPLREYMSVAVSYLKPESVPADVKIILVGDEETYSLINYYDDDFNKLFKVHAAFDYEMDSSEKNLNSIIHFIKNTAKERSLPPFNEYAVAALLEYLARLAERQDKLDSRLGKLRDVMEETAVWSKSDIITAADVTRAICERNYRSSLYEEKLSDLIDKNIVMIDTTGAKKAQINGLAVIDSGDYIFAKPSRITATAYAGKAGVVNIEKEAEMSGSIHDKGVEVITGFLGQKYAQEFPLSVSCRICFEQNYNGIDGDSASSTELYCILSSLADVPIKQSLAVTGSINQRGEIQPIGGVTYKIEGFFDLCEKRGLTGKQGVIIPRQNIHDLVLCDKVIDAVQKGVFHIYAIDHLDDGIQLLMNTPAGEKNDKGKYPSETIHGKVYRKLKDFFKKSVDEGY